MSADALTAAIARAGEAFIRSIETAGASPLTAREHLDLLDEITDWLVRAHIAHDIVWNNYYARAGERVAERRPPPPPPPPPPSTSPNGGPDA